MPDVGRAKTALLVNRSNCASAPEETPTGRDFLLRPRHCPLGEPPARTAASSTGGEDTLERGHLREFSMVHQVAAQVDGPNRPHLPELVSAPCSITRAPTARARSGSSASAGTAHCTGPTSLSTVLRTLAVPKEAIAASTRRSASAHTGCPAVPCPDRRGRAWARSSPPVVEAHPVRLAFVADAVELIARLTQGRHCGPVVAEGGGRGGSAPREGLVAGRGGLRSELGVRELEVRRRASRLCRRC